MLRNKKSKLKNSEKGTTLIGVLIGITILTVALAAQVQLLANTLKREAYLRNLIIATNLGREGIEIAFMMRSTDGWDVLKSKKSSHPNGFCTDISDPSHTFGINCETSELKLRSNGIFNYGFFYNTSDTDDPNFSDPESKKKDLWNGGFRRIIKVDKCPEPDDELNNCLNIITEVRWDENDYVTLEKKLYNWYIP